MNIRAFITHKKAEKFADCQDRFGVNTDTKSLAVSDGMGSSWQQKIWAQILVEEFTKSKDWLPTLENIKPLCLLWRNKVEASIEHLKETNAPQNIIFRNERSLAEGRSAGATFVGIRFSFKEWKGSVLGDSCLIEWDGNEAIFHTSQDGGEFDSYPDYFDSDKNKTGKGTPRNINGTLLKETHLLLVSDPFSDFLLEHKKQGDIAEYINQILKLSSHEDFENLVEAWRNAGMHNDDTTLVIVEDDENEAFTTLHLDDMEKLKAAEVYSISKTPETEKKPEDATESNPNIPKGAFTPNEDEKDFIKDLRTWLDQSLKKKGKGKSKKEFLKFFDKFISKIIERYKITKR